MSGAWRNLAGVAGASVLTAPAFGFALTSVPLPKLHGGLSFVAQLPVIAGVAGISLAVAAIGYGSGLFAATSVERILGSLMLRPVLTLGLAGGAAGMFPALRTPYFFLVLAAVYVVNLGMETWQVLGAMRGEAVAARVSEVSRVSGSAHADQLSGSRAC